MTDRNWAAAYARVRVYEGGNVDDPVDPGGRTSRGVTQRVYDGYRARHGLPRRDVWKADDTEIADIYKAQYGDAVRFADLPAGVDLVVFDGAINSGPAQSVKWLQAALNDRHPGAGLRVDGMPGEATLAALAADDDNDRLIEAILALRLGFLHHLRTWSRFGAGWSARVANLRKIGEAWASGSIGPMPVSVEALGGHRKATPEHLAAAPVPIQAGAAVTGGALGLDGITSGVQSAAGNLQIVSDLSPLLHVVFIALTLAGVGLTLWAAWKVWKAEKAKAGEIAKPVEEGADVVAPEVDVAEAPPLAPAEPPAPLAPAVEPVAAPAATVPAATDPAAPAAATEAPAAPAPVAAP